MDAPDAAPPSSPARAPGVIAPALAAALLAAILLAVQAWTMAARGPWYDEFYTFWVTRPAFGWTEALRSHWLADNHPPLFYALSRATGWLGATIEARRQVNLLVGLAALATGIAALRGTADRARLGVLFLVFLVAQGPAIVSAAELRSYYLSFAASAVLVWVLVLIWLAGSTRGRRGLLAGALLVAFNVHIATSLICGTILFTFIAAAALRREWALARGLFWPGLAAGGLLVAITAVQLPLWVSNTEAFWIQPGLGAARWAIEMALVRSLSGNLLLTGLGLIGAALLVAQAASARAISRELAAILALGAGCALAAALLVGIHLAFRPFVIERYLVALLPAIGLALALGCDHLARRLRVGWAAPALLLVLSATSLLTLASNARATVAKTSWARTAAAIAEVVRRCPDTAVHVDPRRWNADLIALPPADNAEVVPFAYADMAARFAFRLEPEGSRRISATCPTLFWAEQGQRTRSSAAEVLHQLQGEGFGLHRLTLRRIGDGWIAAGTPR